MAVSLGIWSMSIGLLGLLSVSFVYGRGDTFHVEDAEENNLDEAADPPDDILDINLGLILPEAPESSFLMEGDIIKLSPFRLFSSANPRWPKKRGIVQIPYVISYRYDQSSLKIIMEAFDDFARLTCVRFIPYSYQRDFVSIVPLSGCFSSVGRIGGMQVVSLAPACLQKGKGVALHEFMHVLGFWHEHSRADRDKYISISWNEILTGFEMNFLKSWNTNMLGDYDYSSVMHYSRNAFSMTGLPTIIPLSNPDIYLGQRWNLSQSDITRVNKLYKCSQVAAQPETSAGRAVKEKMMDFIPSATQPCSTESQAENSTAWSPYTKTSARETPGATISSSRTVVGKGTTDLETETQRAEVQKQSMVSPETSSKAEESGEFLGATAEMPHTNQSREMEPTKVVSTGQEVSLKNPTISARELRRQSPSSKETYLLKEQEARTRETLETEFPLSFLTKGPGPFPTETVQGATVKPGQKGAGAELFEMTEAAHQKPTGDLSTALGMSSTPITQSGEPGHANGSPRPTEIPSFSLVGNQPMFHQTVSTPGNESGNLASVSLTIGNVESEVTSTSYRMLFPKSTALASGVMGPGEGETLEAESQSPASSTTILNQTGMEGQEVEGFQSKEQSTLVYLWSTTSRKDYGENKEDHSVFFSVVALPPGSAEAQESHLGWTTAGTSSFPQSAVTGQLAPSRLKEETISGSSSAELSTDMEPFSYLTARVTESEMGAAHSELSSQASVSWKMDSLVMESNQATHPTERPFLPRTVGQRPGASWSPPSHTRGYGLSVLTKRQATPVAVQGEASEPALETASITAIGRLTMEQKIGLSHGEEAGTGPTRETKAHRRSTLWRLFSAEPFSSQMPIQAGQQLAGTQWQPSPTLSIETAIPGEGKVQVQTRNPRQETMVALRLCGGKLSGSLSEKKPSPMGQTSKSGVSPLLKLGPTGGGSPGLETKEHSSPLEEISPPVRERSTTLSWVSPSSSARERKKMGNYTALAKEETSSARMNTLPHNRTPEKTEAHGQGTAPTRSVGASHFSSVMVFSKPIQKRSQRSSLSWGTESAMNTDSPSPQSLEPATKTHIASLPTEVSSGEGRPTEPVNATEETLLHRRNWVATLAREVRNEQSGARSPALGVQPTALPHVSTEGKPLLPTARFLESPKNSQEASAGSHSPKESQPSTGKATAEGTATAFLTHLPLESWESQTIPSIGSKKATSKRWGDVVMEADASRATSTGPYRMPSAEVSSLGSHQEHIVGTTSPELQPDHQSDMEPLEETSWLTSGAKALVEEKGKNLTKKSGIYISEGATIAIYTSIEPKGSGQNGPGMAGATLIDGRPPSPLTYPSSIEEAEESTAAQEETKSMPRSAGTISNLHSGAPVISHPIHGETGTHFLLSAQNSLGAEEMETTFPLQMNSEGMGFAAKVAVTPGISQTHTQTPGPAEPSIWSKLSTLDATQHKGEYGHREFPSAKRIWVGMGNRGLLNPSSEPSKKPAETQIAVKLEKGTRNDLKDRKPEQSTNRSVDKPGYLHRVAKRSLLETMLSNAGHHTPRELKGRATFPKEHMLRKLLAFPTRVSHHTLAPGLFKVRLGNPFMEQKDGATLVENQMEEPTEATVKVQSTGSASKPASCCKTGQK